MFERIGIPIFRVLYQKTLIMKKLILVACFALFVSASLSAQNYTTALGLGIDFGDGVTFVGPSVKHAFAEHHVGQAELGFEDGATAITALYQYHDQFENAGGLYWFAGGGASLFLIDGGDSLFSLRGTVGLDYKIPDVPLAFSFDWRPALALDSDVNDRFEAGAFGIGIRYVLN